MRPSNAQADELEARLGAELTREERSRLREMLKRLRRQHAEVARIDFFDAPEGGLLASRFGRMAQALSAGEGSPAPAAPAAIETYRETRWVTRPRPHVDRLSCIWLIRRFINPQAVVRYSPMPEPDEVAFDMPHGEFTHRGHLCTFETMVRAFGLEDPGPSAHGRNHPRDRPQGWSLRAPGDRGHRCRPQGLAPGEALRSELEAHGVALFEGLYADLSRRTRQPPPKRRGRKGYGEHA